MAAASPVAAIAASIKKKDYSFQTYGQFALAGALCCSVTHTAVVPIDVVKTRLQTNPGKYAGMVDGFKKIVAEEGAGMLLKGAGPTAVGYFLQGAGKFGFNEFFKKKFFSYVEPATAQKYRLPIWMGASGCAEVIADLFLCPLEATRIRLVSDPSFAKGLVDGFGRLAKQEGILSMYRGLPPLLFKQVPYTMAKFSVFEIVSESVYRALPTPKEKLSTGAKLGVSLGSGLAAGFAAAIISQPADTVLSKVAQNKDASIGSVLKQLGAKQLFLGLGARLAMVGTLTAGQFFVYDGCKELMGVSAAQLAAKGY